MRRRGFTLIEVIVIAAIIAALAALVAPRLRETRERALVATLRSDLRRFRVAQEEHRTGASDGRYAAAVDQLGGAFAPSEDVTITVVRAGRTGYVAEARHPGTDVRCVQVSGDDREELACGVRAVPPPESVRAVP